MIMADVTIPPEEHDPGKQQGQVFILDRIGNNNKYNGVRPSFLTVF